MPLAGHRRVALDSNVLIYALEGHPRFAEPAAVVLDAVERGEVDAVMASIGLLEVLTKPAMAGDAAAFEGTADALRDLAITIIELDADVATDAAWLRGAVGGSAADAIHLATARRAGVTAFITNDRRVRSVARLEVVYLDRIG
jgi:predicted nucleic acid-binding protein